MTSHYYFYDDVFYHKTSLISDVRGAKAVPSCIVYYSSHMFYMSYQSPLAFVQTPEVFYFFDPAFRGANIMVASPVAASNFVTIVITTFPRSSDY